MVRMCDFRFPDRLTNELRERMRISANIEDLIVHSSVCDGMSIFYVRGWKNKRKCLTWRKENNEKKTKTNLN